MNEQKFQNIISDDIPIVYVPVIFVISKNIFKKFA